MWSVVGNDKHRGKSTPDELQQFDVGLYEIHYLAKIILSSTRTDFYNYLTGY